MRERAHARRSAARSPGVSAVALAAAVASSTTAMATGTTAEVNAAAAWAQTGVSPESGQTRTPTFYARRRLDEKETAQAIRSSAGIGDGL
jgi:hypothetical protein